MRKEELKAIYEKAIAEKEAKDCVKNPLCLFHLSIKDVSRKATKKDYTLWLEGFLKNGGKITHTYDYPIKMEDFIVIEKDFKLFPLHGAQSIGLIIKEGVKRINGIKDHRGHNELYFMDDYSNIGNFIPMHSDIIQ